MSEVDITVPQDWTALSLEDLERAVQFHNKAYWVHDDALISDPEFDRLVETLRDRAPDSPVLEAIGPAGAGSEFGEVEGVKVEHDPPMLSLDKCYDEETLRKWFDKFEGDAVVTPKVDGVAVCIRYDASGALAIASTRGNGITGELITENVRHIVDVPERIDANRPIEVRGEAYMPWSVFRAKFEEQYSSPRNLTAGALKQKNPEQTANYEIHFFGYDVLGPELASEHEKMELMAKLGFTPVDHRVVPHDNLQEAFEELEATRATLDYDTDGVVYKADSIEEQQRMGATAHHPRFAIAYKFQGESGTSTLREVLWSVSRTGAINPVGVVDPVQLSGASVTRVSLHNLSIMEKLGGEQGLRIGSRVVMVRRGGVIPHLERVLEPGDVEIRIPEECPDCGAPTFRDSDVLCADHADDCRTTRLRELEHYASVTEMKGFGPRILEALWEAGFLRDLVGFYSLKVEDLTQLERVGEKTAENLVGMVDERRTLPAATFLRALGIEELGKHVSKIMVHEWGDIDQILRVSRDELAAIHTIGDIIADKVVAGLGAREEQIRSLLEHVDLVFPSPSDVPNDGELAGKSFLFTGALESMSRKDAQARVQELGGETPSGVKKELDFLVIGDADLEKFNDGWRTSKLKKAEAFNDSGGNIRIIGESEFLEMIEN